MRDTGGHFVGDDCQPGHDQPEGAALSTDGHIAITATGKVLTNTEIDRFVVEAEEGYDLTELVEHKAAVNWIRWRFKANGDDYRAVYAPTPGPYWCTGYGGDDDDAYSIVVAYLRPGQHPRTWWPEAHDVSFAQPCAEITFTDRFPKPDWWEEHERQEQHGRNWEDRNGQRTAHERLG